MRAKEFLFEDYNQRLDSDLTNLLIGAKGNGATNIDPVALANELQNMGYSVDEISIMALLQNNPNVSNASPDGITLTGGEDAGGGEQGEDSASRVSDMAQDATDLG